MNSRDRVKASMDALFPPEEEPNLGEGISRPSNLARAREHRLLISFARAKPMKVTLLAESPKAAIKYASNRWPGATVQPL